jgi:thiol-disulfide isomerase/thioredoxin
MPSIRIIPPLALVGALVLPPASGPALAQEAAPQTGANRSLEDLNASYRRKLLELDRQRIADLAALAARANPAEADAAYAQLFHLAIARELFREAEPAAERSLASATRGRDVRTLATLVRILAMADQGEHERSLAELKALIQGRARGDGDAPGSDSEMTLAVGEAYLQHLIRAGRYDVARKLCALACAEDAAPAALKDHFETRMGRLDLLGKAAPPISGADVDGKNVSLADRKGKVVLVDFWATWCPPCVAALPRLKALAAEYHDRGFEIVGVNVDAMHEDVKETRTALPVVRRFLAAHAVTWTNLLNGQGAGDFTKAYGVEDIPANFLIGRDGRIIGLDLSDDQLERAVARALGDEPGDRPK